MTFDPAELKRLEIGVNKLKGLTLRPFGKNGRNEYTSAKDFGLPKMDFTNATQLQKNVNVIPLEQTLKKGFEVESVDGSTVVFGQTLLEHWNENKVDLKAKETRIPYMQSYKDAVKSPDEKWDQEGQRVYIKKFIDDKGKQKVSVVFVKNNGSVYNAYTTDNFEKTRKGLSHEVFK